MIKIVPRFLSLYSLLFVLVLVFAQEPVFVSSGDDELDRIRLEVAKQPTNRGNFELKALKMKLWVVTLQQQGAEEEFYCLDAEGNGDGTTTCKWMYKMGNKVEESTPAMYML